MIRTFWGNPGCGKTTLAVKLLLKNQKKYLHCLSNFEHTVPGAGYYDSLDKLGEWIPPRHTYCAWDESGIDFNSRSYKSMSKACIAFHKKHRHQQIDIDCFSQAWDDIDITLRRLSVQYWYMYRIGPWTLCRRVYKRTGVDKETKQIIDQYDMASMLWLLVWPLQLGWPFDKKFTLTYRPFYYKYFDTFEMLPIPVKLPRWNKPDGPAQGSEGAQAPSDPKQMPSGNPNSK